MNSFVLKGHVCYNKSKNELITQEKAYVVCIDGKSKGVFSELPQQYAQLPVIDYGDCIMTPSGSNPLIYPYFFVNPETQGVAGVAKWSLLILVAFMTVGYLLFGIDKLLGRNKKRS